MTRGSYEAYCLDEAIWYFGAIVEAELEKASMSGTKKSKAQTKAEAARKRVLAKYFGGDTPQQYADPALLLGG